LEECYPSGVFSASYIKQQHPEAKHVYVIGGTGLQDELRKVNIEISLRYLTTLHLNNNHNNNPIH